MTTYVMKEAPPVIGWAILELMGHRKLGGWVTEQEVAGAAFVRIDVPGPDNPVDPMGEVALATQFYSPSAVYCITPTTEEIARAVAANTSPAPVSRYELPAPKVVLDADVLRLAEQAMADGDLDEIADAALELTVDEFNEGDPDLIKPVLVAVLDAGQRARCTAESLARQMLAVISGHEDRVPF